MLSSLRALNLSLPMLSFLSFRTLLNGDGLAAAFYPISQRTALAEAREARDPALLDSIAKHFADDAMYVGKTARREAAMSASHISFGVLLGLQDKARNGIGITAVAKSFSAFDWTIALPTLVFVLVMSNECCFL